MTLILSRRQAQGVRLLFNDGSSVEATVRVHKLKAKYVELAIEAPDCVAIVRDELSPQDAAAIKRKPRRRRKRKGAAA